MTTATAPVIAAAMNSNLQVTIFQKTYEMEAVLDSVVEYISEPIPIAGATKIPDAFIYKAKEDNKSAHQVVIPFLKAISGDPNVGTTNPIGTEVDLAEKFLTLYANDWNLPIAGQRWGSNARYNNYYQFYQAIGPLLEQYKSELNDKYFHEAGLLGISLNLVAAPTSLSQRWNPNMVFANYDGTARVVSYDTDDLESETGGLSGSAVMTENIGDAAYAATNSWNTGAANTGAQGCGLRVSFLEELEYLARTRFYLKDVKGKGLILLAPYPNFVWFRDSTKTGSLPNVASGLLGLTKWDEAIPGEKLRIGNILLVSDARYAQITVSGTSYPASSSSGYTVTPAFLNPGRDDDRTTSKSEKTFNCGLLMGAGALARRIVEDAHNEEQEWQYGRDYGKLIAQAIGWQLCRFASSSTPTSNSDMQQEGCVSVMFNSYAGA